MSERGREPLVHLLAVLVVLTVAGVSLASRSGPAPRSAESTPVSTPTTTPTATPSPTTTLTPTASPTATPVANPLAGYTVDALAQRAYDGGEIVSEGVTRRTDAYTAHAIAYTTDGDIRVTGLMNVPTVGDGPFPVILLLHGGIDQGIYEPGDGTRGTADFLARQGYLTIAPDYRTYNDTGGSSSPLKIPWSVDVLNLIAALPTLPEADAERVGLWGHSRGGGVASYPLVLGDALPTLRAVVLYAPLSFDQAVNWKHYVNVFAVQWPLDDARTVGSPETNPEGYAAISPINYLERVAAPVQIHHGDADNILPVEWSRELRARLDEHGKTVEYYEYPGADHAFTGEDYNQFLGRVLAFFDEHVRGGSAPADPLY